MPIRKSDYHPEWPRISLEVREAAGWQCEWCGVPNKWVIRRGQGDTWEQVEYTRFDLQSEWEPTQNMTWARLKFHRLTRVVLTVAHLDRNRDNNEKENLAALCQRCHLRHDIHQHIRNRRYGRYHDREHQLKFEYEKKEH